MQNVFELVALENFLNLAEHGAPARLKALVQGVAQGAQHRVPSCGGLVRQARVGLQHGPFGGHHAAQGRRLLEGQAGHSGAHLAGARVHPHLELLRGDEFLRGQHVLDGQRYLALHAQQQTRGQHLHRHGQRVELAPYLEPGQSQEHVRREEEPQRLVALGGDGHAAIVLQGLRHGGVDVALPVQPQGETRGAHARFAELRQAAQQRLQLGHPDL
ncbi:diacylglycerol kinase family protein [Nitratidesulfovibrio sp. HK-II]|uniref:diacylglycerol kinase family protein n=1 Tax=Nitratidesulfovibrio sp. HK-II TaxID=2009266 RepID=UPI000E2F6B20